VHKRRKLTNPNALTNVNAAQHEILPGRTFLAIKSGFLAMMIV
jgi:hypothetical protein